jgi:hypothetical protein
LSSVENFDELIGELRSKRQFYDALYTTAIGYRLSNLFSEILFNPNISNKTPDILLKNSGESVIVECTQVNFPQYFDALENLEYKTISYFHSEIILKRKVWNHIEIIFKKEKVSEQEIRSCIDKLFETQITLKVFDTESFTINIIPIEQINGREDFINYSKNNKSDIYGFLETSPGKKDDVSTWDLTSVNRQAAFFVRFPNRLQEDVEKKIIKRLDEKYARYKNLLENYEFYVFINLPPARRYGLDIIDDKSLSKRLRGNYFKENCNLINGIFLTQRKFFEHHWTIDSGLFLNPHTKNHNALNIHNEMKFLDENSTFYYPVLDYEPSRNDLCPCGSNSKYKKCCGFYGNNLIR